MNYDIQQKFFYLVVIFVLTSGAVADELIHAVSIISIIITLLAILHLANKKTYSSVAMAIISLSAFVLIFVYVKYGINLQDRFSGGSDFDSSGTATIKFFLKCLIIAIFFPVCEKLETKIADGCKIIIIYIGAQAIITTIIINVVAVPIEVANNLFPLIGGVADWEPFPLHIVAPSFDFTYFRPKFIFREPQGLGYFVMTVYFMYAMLAKTVSRGLIFFIFIILLVTLAKAALIIFIIYMSTYWATVRLVNKKLLLIFIIAIGATLFMIFIFSFLGHYVISRISGLLRYNFSNIEFLPLGINSGLWLGFNDIGSVDISYFTIFYELGIIIGVIYIISLVYLLLKIYKSQSHYFVRLFPIYVAFLIFLASGSTYSSGGGILIFYYLYILSSRFFHTSFLRIK